MITEEYVEKKKEIQQHIVEFLDDEDGDEEIFINLNNIFEDQCIRSDKHDLKTLLYLIAKLSKYHRRSTHFFEKIEKILLIFKSEITNYFPNTEIFKIFKSNKRILLFLIEENILTIDHIIYNEMNKIKYKNAKYPEYFSPEIKKFKLQNNIKDNTEEIEETKEFYEKRKIGENDELICQLIRKDLIDEFISYVNQNQYPLNSDVKTSIYETNSLLQNQKTKLIEYATFFGSSQIFKYLYLNKVELESNLWIYAIHGDDEEIVRILEDKSIEPEIIHKHYDDDDDENDAFPFQTFLFIQPNNNNDDDGDDSLDPFLVCIKEAIKCHHNHIVSYLHSNLIKENIEYIDYKNNYNENVLYYSFHYYNFTYVSTKLKSYCIFFYACEFDYFKLVELLLKTRNININARLILKNIFFLFITLFY